MGIIASQKDLRHMTQLREASKTVTSMRTVTFWLSVMAARMKIWRDGCQCHNLYV